MDISGRTRWLWKTKKARMIDWRKRMRERIEELGLDMQTISLRAGRGKTYVFDMLEDGSSPTIEKLLSVCHEIGWTLYDLFGDGTPDGLKLVLQHRIQANEMWADNGANKPKELPLAFLAQDLVTLEIETNDYRSSGYRRGDVVSGARSFGRHIDNLVGCDCIIETADGEKKFKILAKGSVRGRYTLRSFDPSNDDEKDVKINWAAPVQMILRGVM